MKFKKITIFLIAAVFMSFLTLSASASDISSEETPISPEYLETETDTAPEPSPDGSSQELTSEMTDESYDEYDSSYYDESDDINANVTEEPTCRAKVIEILSDEVVDGDFAGGSIPIREVHMNVKVLSGPRKGEIRDVCQQISIYSESRSNEMDAAQVGDIISVYFTVNKYGTVQTGTMVNFISDYILLIFGTVLILLLFILGGFKGLKAFAALIITSLSVIFVMIPMIYNGFNPTLAASITCVFVICVTLIIVYSFTKKTLAAALGATGGVIVAGILSYIMIELMHYTGVTDNESMSLIFTDNGTDLNLKGIMFAAVLIGSLGGTIDVGISIASALEELSQKAPRISAGEMMRSGINIGRDILGASLNTLILAYVGGSIQLLMLFAAYDMALIDIINTEYIGTEILRAIVGSFGLSFTVPITSFVCSAMMCSNGFKKSDVYLFLPRFLVKNKLKHCWRIKSGKLKFRDMRKNTVLKPGRFSKYN